MTRSKDNTTASTAPRPPLKAPSQRHHANLNPQHAPGRSGRILPRPPMHTSRLTRHNVIPLPLRWRRRRARRGLFASSVHDDCLMRHGIPSRATTAPHRPFALSPAAPPRPRPWAGSVPVRTWQCPGAPSFHFHRRGRRDHQGTCTSTGAGEGGLRTAGNCWRRLAARRATTGLNSQQQPPPPPPVAEPASPSLVMTHTSARCLQEGGGL